MISLQVSLFDLISKTHIITNHHHYEITVRLQWKLGDNGGSRILGFSLNFREENGEWEEIRLGRKVLTHDLHDLSCKLSNS